MVVGFKFGIWESVEVLVVFVIEVGESEVILLRDVAYCMVVLFKVGMWESVRVLMWFVCVDCVDC